MAHPDEEEGKEYFLVQLVKSRQSGILADQWLSENRFDDFRRELERVAAGED
jgi:hypothetical protein